MKKFINLFEWIWLSENSAIIYINLLEHWKSTITELSNYTTLHRVQLYRLLPNLIESWFVIITKKWNKKYYFPASPTKINDAYLEIQEKNKTCINLLLEKYNNIDKKPTVIYNEWKKWITSIFNDITESLKKWDIFYRITSEVDTEKINKEYLPPNYREKRDKKELERYVIMSSNAWKNKKQRLERELKIIPKNIDEFQDNILLTIYADKVWFIDFNTETSILIENKQIADFQKKLFKLLFKSL
jgi:sugar-specific transcriptional regulator TrmB